MESNKKKILVVDDEKSIRDFFKWLLSLSNLEVVEAENGYDAIKLAQENKFNIFFIDLRMPGIDGFETSRQIRQINPEATITIITGYATCEAVKQAQDQGYRIIRKPFDIKDIEDVIKNAN
ncbi:MAG: response regulator [Candidatus Omnitrophota bacterium]